MREVDTDIAGVEDRVEWRAPLMTRFEAESAEAQTAGATDGLGTS